MSPQSHRFAAITFVTFFGATAALCAETSAVSSSADQIARGKYLARAGDCVSCHTAPDGKPLAGGRSVDTPFGSMKTPNITPDKATGIGAWSDDDFYRAMHEGIGKEGQYLYPVFPFASYTKVSRADVLAIKAYIFSLAPVSARSQSNDLEFPFNVRQSLAVWRKLYFHPGDFVPDSKQSAQVNRGAYLVQGLGHCGECHTPRNAMGATQADQAYEGGLVQGWFAPNITSDRREGIGGWSDRQLQSFLQHGAARGKGVAIGPMREVVHSSLQYLTDADIHAMTGYLKSIPAAEGKQPSLTASSSTPEGLGAQVYLAHCASCHQLDGRGIPGAIPPLAKNGAVIAPSPATVLSIVVSGAPATAQSPIMPAFGAELDDVSIAAVANYVRSEWSNGAAQNADPHAIVALRKTATAPFAGDSDHCPAPTNATLMHAVAEPEVRAMLDKVTDANMGTQSKVIVERVKTGIADRASAVNDLSAAYCQRLVPIKNLTPVQKRSRYYRFGRLVYRQLGGGA